MISYALSEFGDGCGNPFWVLEEEGACDEHVDLGAVAPDLRTGALVVRQRVRRVAVLVEEHVVGIVRGDLLRALVGLR